MAVENVKTSTSTDKYGNAYTAAISNDKLSNEDFLKLMLTELKYQDPTKPMDSQNMLQSQMQMSAIETNVATIEAMQSLSETFANMALSNATNMMGKHVDAFSMVPMYDANGNVMKDTDGNVMKEKQLASYIVDTVQVNDGKVVLNARELVAYQDKVINLQTNSVLKYDKNGRITGSDGNPTDYYIKMEDGRFVLSDTGKITVTNANGVVQYPTFESDGQTYPMFAYAGYDRLYSPESTPIEYNNVQKIYNS
jgi:flagellar basal-body rod modification protein FlgD